MAEALDRVGGRRERLRPMRCAILFATFAVATTAMAAGLDYPWCMGSGGGRFLCSDKEERMRLAKDSVQLAYLDFIQKAFVADTIRYVPMPDDVQLASTEHRGGGGINLSANTDSGVRERIRLAATEWFHFYCFARGGKTVRYPINGNPDLANVERLACHPKAERSDQVLAGSPMFGIEASKSSAYGGIEKDPVIVMRHLGNGDEVRKRWGYPKVFKIGDASEQGTVVELKPPLARVQPAGGIASQEKWVDIKDLRPLSEHATSSNQP